MAAPRHQGAGSGGRFRDRYPQDRQAARGGCRCQSRQFRGWLCTAWLPDATPVPGNQTGLPGDKHSRQRFNALFKIVRSVAEVFSAQLTVTKIETREMVGILRSERIDLLRRYQIARPRGSRPGCELAAPARTVLGLRPTLTKRAAFGRRALRSCFKTSLRS